MTHAHDFLGQFSPTTRATYGNILEDFRTRIGVEPQEATQEHMLAYTKALNGQASATVAKKLAGLRSFMTYLGLRGVRADNPMIALRVPKVDRLRSIKYLTVDQVKELVNSFDESKKGTRDRALISLFLHGLRISEVRGLNVEDYREGNLRVTGKGDKMRIVPLSPLGQKNLEAYLGWRRTGPLFLSVFRHGDRIEERALRNIVYAATERVGERMHPHALRHTYATHLMRSGAPLGKVQQVLGHANPATTMIYSHLDVGDLRSMVEQFDLLRTS